MVLVVAINKIIIIFNKKAREHVKWQNLNSRFQLADKVQIAFILLKLVLLASEKIATTFVDLEAHSLV